MKTNKQDSLPPDGYITTMSADVSLKKQNTNSEKY